MHGPSLDPGYWVFDARNTQAELGWVLDAGLHRKGFAAEAVRALLSVVCFNERAVRRVVVNCFLDNQASWRLMERGGMRREGLAMAESLHRTGYWLDTVAYALLAEEWRADADALDAPQFALRKRSGATPDESDSSDAVSKGIP